MKSIWSHRLLLSFLVLLLAIIPLSSALATPPEFSVVPLDFTFPVVGCEFPVEARLTATLKVSVHYDKNGDFKMQIERVLPDSQSTYTNLESGSSITSTWGAGNDKIIIDGDGTVLFIASGIFDIFPMPGQGPVVQDVGHIIVDVTTGELLFSAGQFTVHGPGGSVEALCAALE